jgi:hypothetical protein
MVPAWDRSFFCGASCYDDESLCSMLFTCFVYLYGYIRDCLCDLGTLCRITKLMSLAVLEESGKSHQ